MPAETGVAAFVAKGFWVAIAGAFTTMASLFGLHVKNDSTFRQETKEAMNVMRKDINKQEVSSAETITHLSYLRQDTAEIKEGLAKLIEKNESRSQ